jgi:glucose dehydrogenase
MLETTYEYFIKIRSNPKETYISYAASSMRIQAYCANRIINPVNDRKIVAMVRKTRYLCVTLRDTARSDITNAASQLCAVVLYFIYS